ncbi:MAG: hypothetical protein KGJ13_09215 [Patescibacteria group bacterium]|nr:hypothetical protein [Patescibacteria group bacterium]
MLDLIPMFDDRSHPQLNRLLNEEALRCENCGAHQTSLIFMSESRIHPRYVVACLECKFQEPPANSLFAAIGKWNKGQGFRFFFGFTHQNF